MTAREFLDHLSVSGIRLSVTDGTLKVDAPAGVLTAELKTELTKHKTELLRFVSSEFCKICKASLLTDHNGRHMWCSAGHYDAWLPNQNRQPESINYCAVCGAWLQDDGDCSRCR